MKKSANELIFCLFRLTNGIFLILENRLLGALEPARSQSNMGDGLAVGEGNEEATFLVPSSTEGAKNAVIASDVGFAVAIHECHRAVVVAVRTELVDCYTVEEEVVDCGIVGVLPAGVLDRNTAFRHLEALGEVFFRNFTDVVFIAILLTILYEFKLLLFIPELTELIPAVLFSDWIVTVGEGDIEIGILLVSFSIENAENQSHRRDNIDLQVVVNNDGNAIVPIVGLLIPSGDVAELEMFVLFELGPVYHHAVGCLDRCVDEFLVVSDFHSDTPFIKKMMYNLAA